MMRSSIASTVGIVFASGMLAIPAKAASLCDAVPGAAVAATLGAPGKLTPEDVTPAGCTYRTGPGEQLTVTVLVEEDKGSARSSFDTVLQSIMFDKLPGVGEAAATHSRRIGKRWDQLVQFRAKGRLVTLIVISYADQLPTASLTKLGALFATKL